MQELQAVAVMLHRMAFCLSGKVIALHLDNSTANYADALGLLCLKGLCFFVSSFGMLSQFLDNLGCVWLRDGIWSQTKCHINWKVRLSAKHEIVGADPCG